MGLRVRGVSGSWQVVSLHHILHDVLALQPVENCLVCTVLLLQTVVGRSQHGLEQGLVLAVLRIVVDVLV